MAGSPPGTNHGLRSERHDYSECQHKKGKAHYRSTELVATVPTARTATWSGEVNP